MEILAYRVRRIHAFWDENTHDVITHAEYGTLEYIYIYMYIYIYTYIYIYIYEAFCMQFIVWTINYLVQITRKEKDISPLYRQRIMFVIIIVLFRKSFFFLIKEIFISL